MSPNDIVIRTEKLSRTFSHDGVQTHVLRKLDTDIRRGDFTVIMGPSGAGKTTLLYALSGMDRPSLGAVEVAGVRISDRSPDQLARFRREHCGFVFQQINLLDSLSLHDNVMAAGLLVSRDRQQVAARATELLERVGIDLATAGRFAQTLSGGEAQRAAIARALINDPTIVFADEPDRSAQLGEFEAGPRRAHRGQPGRPDDRHGHPRPALGAARQSRALSPRRLDHRPTRPPGVLR